jgi:hypothetical protein
MRRWKPQEDLFVVTLPEARWSGGYQPPAISFFRRRRTWLKTKA